MSLSSCPDCGHGVSPSATNCPTCGAQLQLGCFESCVNQFLIAGLIIGAIVVVGVLVLAGMTHYATQQKATQSVTNRNTAAFTQAMLASGWAMDVHVAAGHANIGVLREEKDWSSASIARFTCATAKMHGLHRQVTWVRFVDSRQIAAGKTPRQAEIVKVKCEYAALP